MIGSLVAVLIVAEIIAFVAVAHLTSWGLAILLLLAPSAVGSAVARRVAVSAFRQMAQARRSGLPPGVPVADSAVALVGALLLVVPGFVTDFIGLTMVLPPSRRLVRLLIGRRLAGRMLRRGGFQVRTFGSRTHPPPTEDPDVIEGTLDGGGDSTTPS